MNLRCQFKNIIWDLGGAKTTLYSCVVQNPNIIEQNPVIRSIKGKHLGNKVNADVEALIFNVGTINYVPKDLHKFFANIVVFEMSGVGLKSISKADLVGFEGLKTLDLGDNELTSLPDDLLDDMTKLEKLFFNKNRLERVSSKVLDHRHKIIQTLKLVDFEDNPGIHLKYDMSHACHMSTLMVDAIELSAGLDEERDKVEERDREISAKDQIIAEKERELKQVQNDYDNLLEVLGERQLSGEDFDDITAAEEDIDEGEDEPNELEENYRAEAAKTQKKLESLAKVLENLHTTGNFADDVWFRGRKIKVHKAILAAQSSVFVMELKPRPSQSIEIEINEEVLADFIRFFYTHEVQNVEHAIYLLDLAIRYKVPDLITACEDIIIVKDLNSDNALKFYNLADELKVCTKLKRKAFDLLKKKHDLKEYLFDNPSLLNKNLEAETLHEEQKAAKRQKIDD